VVTESKATRSVGSRRREAITEFTIPTANSQPFSIAAGADGALYFTEFNTNKIGRITTTGAITEFTVPTAASNPRGITAGPDGNLWFTEQTGNKIGRVTPTGGFFEYTGLTAGSVPNGITAGPDRTLWFLEFAANKVGRVNTYTLTATMSGTGAGMVTSNPSGITCSVSSSSCSNTFIVNDPVVLTASANGGSTFTGWSGGGCTGTAPCTVPPPSIPW
jgi:streptogramin lyase